MKIVLFGDYPSLQRERVINLLGHDYEVMALTDDASNREVASAFIDADVIVSNFFDATLPPAPRCKLLQSPSAGIEKIDISAVPDGAFLAVAVGHEIPMSEYVCCAMLDDAIGMSGTSYSSAMRTAPDLPRMGQRSGSRVRVPSG